MITEKSALNIIFVVLEAYERIPPDDGLVSRQLLIIFLRHDDLTTYWARELKFDPLFEARSVEYVRLITIQLYHLVSWYVLSFLSDIEIYQANCTLLAMFRMTGIEFLPVLLYV